MKIELQEEETLLPSNLDESPRHLQNILLAQNILATDEDESGEESGFESDKDNQQQPYKSLGVIQSVNNADERDSNRNSSNREEETLEKSKEPDSKNDSEKDAKAEKTEKATLQEEELEQRKLAAGGHKFGSQYFKLNNAHLLE